MKKVIMFMFVCLVTIAFAAPHADAASKGKSSKGKASSKSSGDYKSYKK